MGRHRRRILGLGAVAAVLVGVFSTWTKAGGITLNGTQGPNDGWLVVVVALLALGWLGMMEGLSWTGAVGVAGVLGAALVICWTAIADWRDNREVLDASVGWGLLLVVAGGAALAVTAVLRGLELLRDGG
jgi:hypothetical protein